MLWIVLSCLYFIFVIIYTIGLYDLLKGEGFGVSRIVLFLIVFGISLFWPVLLIGLLIGGKGD